MCTPVCAIPSPVFNIIRCEIPAYIGFVQAEKHRLTITSLANQQGRGNGTCEMNGEWKGNFYQTFQRINSLIVVVYTTVGEKFQYPFYN